MVITTNDISKWQDRLAKLAEDPQAWIASYDDRQNEFNRRATLEFPLGELCGDVLRLISLIGREQPEIKGIEKGDRFDAQGIEGKVCVRATLREAILKTDLLPEYRWQIKF